jgi:hypothetical protein
LASSHSNLTGLSAAFHKLFGFDVGGRGSSIAARNLNGYFGGEALFVAEDAVDFAVGIDGRFAEGGGGRLEVVGGEAAVEVGDVAAEVFGGAAPVGFGAGGGAARLDAFAVGVARAQEVCARPVERRRQLLAVLDPGEREQVVLEDAEGRARHLTGDEVGAAARQLRRSSRRPRRPAPQAAPEDPAENIFPLHVLNPSGIKRPAPFLPAPYDAAGRGV